jgi:hypothetical protein
MDGLGIERSLERVSRELAEPFYAKYTVLKNRLLTQDYEYWATGFPGGNNHGRSHIERDLEYLDRLLGEDVLSEELLTPYELFLSMMSILYHDVGILGGRKGHADTSGFYLKAEANEYIIDESDRDIIRAAAVSHPSSKEIENECKRFEQVEHIGRHKVRPRTVAALVRLADELDEDFRRADPVVYRRLAIEEESRFFWEFCQRI